MNLVLNSRSSSSSSPSPILKTERIEIAEADLPPVDNDRFLKPFNVHVFNASNPDHFYVQPLQTMPELGSLMHRLKVINHQPLTWYHGQTNFSFLFF